MDPVDFIFKLGSAAKAIQEKTDEEREKIIKSLDSTETRVLRNCSKVAMRLCPDRELCCDMVFPGQFYEGSECHEFNEAVEYTPKTQADRIRDMNDVELSEFLASVKNSRCRDFCPFEEHLEKTVCSGAECQGKSDADVFYEWLQLPAEKD